MEASSLQKKLVRWAPPALVFFAVLAVFSPCLDNGFVGWDDDTHFLTNSSFRGLGLAQLRWMFTTRRFGLYQPLTWLSFGLDYKLWGLEPWGYHLTSILLHATTAVLFYFVCLGLFEKAAPQSGTDARAVGAASAALAFAIHPLRVESVAWAVERKDVLSCALLLACVWAYIEERITASWCLFALSLGAKVSGIFLPAALLVLDIYPLRRRGRWREKITFFMLAAGAAAVTLGAREGIEKSHEFSRVNIAWRVGQVFYGIAEYPIKTLWPSALSAYYPPRPWFGEWFPYAVMFVALGVGAAWALWTARKRFPAVLAAAAWSVLALAPVSGVIQHGQPYSIFDRYAFLPSLGWSALLGGALMMCRRDGRHILVAAAGALLAVWGLLTWRQTFVWRDSLSLWGHASRVEPSALAFDNLAVAQGAAAQADAAVVSDQRALTLDPSYVSAYANMGLGLKTTGRLDEAETAWRRGLSLEPESVLLQSLLGELLCAQNSCRREGLALLRRAVEHGAENKTRTVLAAALARLGDAAGARRLYEEALATDSDDAVAHVNLGLLLDAMGKRMEARNHYRRALRHRDQRAAAQADWGNSLLAEGRLDSAAFHYAEAIRLEPGMTPAQVNYGNVLARQGRFTEAADRYRAALKKDPSSLEARANLSALRRVISR
jgi:tetratricopeptide (TPR) repeat protein